MRVIVVILALVVVSGCRTGPEPRDRKIAAAKYRVAIELVHDAQMAASKGDTTDQRRKYRDALEELLAARDKNPEDADVRYLLGFVYFSGFKRHTEAETELKQALVLKEEDFPDADNLLGTVLVDADRPSEALPYFDRARKNLLYKTPFFAEMNLGWALYKLGKHQKAAQHLEAAISAQPDLCGGYVKLAQVYEDNKEPEEAERSLDRFLERCDTERLRASVGDNLLATAYYRLGMVRLKRDNGSPELARAAFTTCTERFKSAPVARECEKSLSLIE